MSIQTDNQVKCKTRVADHGDDDVGLYDTVISLDDYRESFENEV